MMFEATTLQDHITMLFSERLSIDVPDSNTDLMEAGLLDSLAFVELLLLLEHEFGMEITVDNLEIDNFRTVAKIAQLVIDHNEMKAKL